MSQLSLGRRGTAARVRRQKLASGVGVTYTRLSGAVLTLTAVPALSAFRSETLPGRVEIAERDYMVAVTDLAAAGAEQVPQIGDRIAETIDGTACTFEVMTPTNGEPAWRYDAQDRGFYRIHTQRVA
jgi:hypothetical protein